MRSSCGMCFTPGWAGIIRCGKIILAAEPASGESGGCQPRYTGPLLVCPMNNVFSRTNWEIQDGRQSEFDKAKETKGPTDMKGSKRKTRELSEDDTEPASSSRSRFCGQNNSPAADYSGPTRSKTHSTRSFIGHTSNGPLLDCTSKKG